MVFYFAPKNSKVYKKRNLDNKDPHAAIKKDISIFIKVEDIILISDFNARTSNNQSIQLRSNVEEDRNYLWLGENEDLLWKGTSQDGNECHTLGLSCRTFVAYIMA